MSVLRERRYQIATGSPIPLILRYSIAAVTLAIAGFAAFTFANNSQTILGSMQLWPQPERTTELFFEKPNELPRTITPDNPLPVAFTVKNREFATVAYNYKIEQITPDANQRTTLKSGTLELAHEQHTDIQTDVVATLTQAPSELAVTLTYQDTQHDTAKNRVISYWLTP